MDISPVPELIAELAAGRMVILVDDEDRENEGDVVLAADCVSAEAINFMAKHCRGLICLTLTRERCQQLDLPPMVVRNDAKHGTAFTVSVEAAEGIDTGISAADRAQTVRVAVAKDAKASDLVRPGHIFPLQAAEGGVLMRAGHTEAGCDLAGMAGLSPAAVICEVMNDDGTMARLPDLRRFAVEHGLKLGTIAELIRYRSRHETLVRVVHQRPLVTPHGAFDSRLFRDSFGGVHLALTLGNWSPDADVLVRVHEPLSVLDLLDTQGSRHSWPLPLALQTIQRAGAGVVLMLNCGETGDSLAAQLQQGAEQTAHQARSAEMDLRTYGVGAQILRTLGVSRMQVLGAPRRMPSMTGYGLETVGFLPLPDGR